MLAPHALWWLALLVPVVLLFLLRRHPRTVPVSSLSLFAVRDPPPLRPRRIRDWPALLLAAATVVAAVLALARPAAEPAPDAVQSQPFRIELPRDVDPFLGAALRATGHETVAGEGTTVRMPGFGALEQAPASSTLAGGLRVDRIVAVRPNHPVLEGVAHKRLALLQTGLIEADGADVLWEGPAGPLLVARDDGEVRTVMIAFSPERSERLGRSAAWPVLVANAVAWVQDAQLADTRSTAPTASNLGTALLWLVLGLLLLEVWLFRRRRMGTRRRAAFLGARIGCLLLIGFAITGPACTAERADDVVVVRDRSESVDPAAVRDRVAPMDAQEVVDTDTTRTDLAAAIERAAGAADAGGRVVVVSDGRETHGHATAAARRAAIQGVRVDTIAVGGPRRPDARLVHVRPSQSRVHEGASVAIRAVASATTAGSLRVALFEGDKEVAATTREAQPDIPMAVDFVRPSGSPGTRRFEVRLDFEGDTIAHNNEAAISVEVGERAHVVILEGQQGEGRDLARALAVQGFDVDTRHPPGLDKSGAHDALVLANVPVFDLPAEAIVQLERYVRDGGALLVTGGPRAFGAGGYLGTPLAAMLPVDVRPRERDTTALVLVLDRSGSMRGAKMNLCRSAALAAAGTLRKDDRIGIVAFDVEPTWVAPLMPAGDQDALRARVAMLDAGGGTHILPAMKAGLDALGSVDARIKHMIVLSDGRTQGGAYAELARRAANTRVTISTVSIGEKTDRELMASIADIGKGRHYQTRDAADLPRILTADTADHAGDLVREGRFTGRTRDRHPMLSGWTPAPTMELTGYVRTQEKPGATVPLLARDDDPLLATRRLGSGVVLAFTSDVAPRWAGPWLKHPDSFSTFWAHVLRDAIAASGHAPLPPAAQPSQETTPGGFDAERLRAIARAGGGTYVAPGGAAPAFTTSRAFDLMPWLVQLFLLLFLVDLVIRRWERVEPVVQAMRKRAA